jgi:putative flippase GtrA
MMLKLGRLVKGETGSTLVQFFRYGLVGGLAFAVDFAALVFLVRFTALHYLTAAALAFVLGLVTNYTMSVLWVFDKRSVKSPVVEFGMFALLGVFGLGLSEVMLYVLTGLLGMHVLFSKVVATGASFIWNFVSRKAILFSLAADPQSAPSLDRLDSPSVSLGVGVAE